MTARLSPSPATGALVPPTHRSAARTTLRGSMADQKSQASNPSLGAEGTVNRDAPRGGAAAETFATRVRNGGHS